MSITCTHVAIHARDVETCAAFYCRYAGLVEMHRRTEHDVTVVWLAEPDRADAFVLVLLGVPHEDAVHPAPLAHLGYDVASRSDVDELAASAAGAGVQVNGPVEGGPIVGYYCMLLDPEGNWVEFSFGQSIGQAEPAA